MKPARPEKEEEVFALTAGLRRVVIRHMQIDGLNTVEAVLALSNCISSIACGQHPDLLKDE